MPQRPSSVTRSGDRRSGSKNSVGSAGNNSNADAFGSHFAVLAAANEDREAEEQRRAASKEASMMDTKLMEGVAKSHNSRSRREYLQSKLVHPKVLQSLDRLCHEIVWTNMTEQELFKRLDENDDGELSKVEIQKGLRSMGISLLPSELDAVLRTFDTDGNGTIDFDEFFDLLSSHAKALGLGCFATSGQVQKDLIHGFEKGSRVKSKVQLPRDVRNNDPRKLGPELDRTNMNATVIGFGEEKGTIKVRFDMSTNRTYNVKPDQLVKASPDKKFGARRRSTVE
jgi:hypothetical protein